MGRTPSSNKRVLASSEILLSKKSIEHGELVGGWTNPFDKIFVKLDHLFQVGVKIKNIWSHHLSRESGTHILPFPLGCSRNHNHAGMPSLWGTWRPRSLLKPSCIKNNRKWSCSSHLKPSSFRPAHIPVFLTPYSKSFARETKGNVPHVPPKFACAAGGLV